MGEEENNISLNKSTSQLPIYERPGRLDPDRHIPMDKRSRVDVNIHYDDSRKGYFKDSDTPEFTEQSANAMNPFEDTALLKGEIKPRATGIKTGAAKVESRIFVPEIDTEEVRAKIKQPVKEPEQPFFIAEEDKAASSDYIADAFSGVETDSAAPRQTASVSVTDVAKLKMYVLLLAIVIVLETAGIALLALL